MLVSLAEQAFRIGRKFSTPQLPAPLKLLETSPDTRGGAGCFASVRLHCGSCWLDHCSSPVHLQLLLLLPLSPGERKKGRNRKRERGREEIMGSNSPRYLLYQHFLQFIYLFIYVSQCALSAVIQHLTCKETHVVENFCKMCQI